MLRQKAYITPRSYTLKALRAPQLTPPPKALLVVGTTSEGVEHAEDTSKAGEVNIEAVQGSKLPPPTPRDTSKEKETS